MRAVKFEEFGDYDVLKLVDLPEPKPGKGEILVKMSAAGIEDRPTGKVVLTF